MTPNAKEDTTNSMLGYKECTFFLISSIDYARTTQWKHTKLMGTGKLTDVYISVIFRKNSSGDKSWL